MDKIKRISGKLMCHKVCLLSALFGALAFVIIYDIHILNPCYTDWLLNGLDGDLSQHYLGWKFFREDSWHFPLGIMENIAYPNSVSVIFTDSIPVLAVFFKLFRFMLPEQFQYFGWWGLLCFILQAVLSARILKKYLKSDAMVVLGSVLFVFAPVFIDRMYWMTSLAAHWLCLLGILFIEEQEKLSENKWKGIGAWAIFGMLCASIHIYFLPMGGILLLGYCLVDVAKMKKGWHSLTVLAGYLFAAAATVAILGGFSSNMGAAFYGLGDYSFNLNGFFNPPGRFYYWSNILSPLPQYIDNQYEGFAYLGLGVILLALITCIHIIGNIKDNKKQWMNARTAAYLLIFILSTIAAASPVITWNEKILLSLPLPGFVRTLWEMFRASGRLVWPAVYLVMIWAVGGDGKVIKKEVKITAMAVCLVLQLYEMKDVLAQKHELFRTKIENESVLQSGAWQEIAAQGKIRHITFMSEFVPDQKLLFSFGDFATDNEMTINDFYFARPMGDAVETARQEAIAEKSEDTIFVFYRKESQNCLNYDLHYYEIDGLIVGCAQELPGAEEMSPNDLSAYHFSFGDNQYVNNGEDIDGVRYLHSYGNTYGPYLNAEPGTYEVSITGSGLSNGELQCYYGHGDFPVEIQEPQITDTDISYYIRLTEAVSDLEFPIWNVGTEDMLIYDIEIRRISE